MSTLNHDTELEEILMKAQGVTPSIDSVNAWGIRQEAKAALNTYFYEQTLELIGEDELQIGSGAAKLVGVPASQRDALRAQLRKAAAERWGQV